MVVADRLGRESARFAVQPSPIELLLLVVVLYDILGDGIQRHLPKSWLEMGFIGFDVAGIG